MVCGNLEWNNMKLLLEKGIMLHNFPQGGEGQVQLPGASAVVNLQQVLLANQKISFATY